MQVGREQQPRLERLEAHRAAIFRLSLAEEAALAPEADAPDTFCERTPEELAQRGNTMACRGRPRLAADVAH
jgi:hypothetical protein